MSNESHSGAARQSTLCNTAVGNNNIDVRIRSG